VSGFSQLGSAPAYRIALCTEVSSLRGAKRRSNPAGLTAITSRPGLLRGACHRTARHRAGPLARNDEHHRSRAAFFVRAPRFAKSFHERASHKGRRSAERRILRDRSAQSQRYRWAGSRRASPFGGRARLPALYHGSRQTFRRWLSPVPRFMAAPTDVTPFATRAASSSQTGVGAGRAGFRTAREWSYEPHPGHRSCSHQSAVTG
jgi:hypothetical protein